MPSPRPVSPRPSDVVPETLSADLDSLRSALARGARTVVAAPLYGYAADMYAIAALASEFGACVVEDAAQAAGATLDGKRVGAFGDVTVLSFGRGKGTTAGAGGALLARHEDWIERLELARRAVGSASRGGGTTAALAAQWLLARPSMYALPAAIPWLKLGEMVYRSASEPRAMSAVATAVLSSALEIDPPEVRVRRAHAADLSVACAASKRFTPIRPVRGSEPGFLRLAVVHTIGSAVADARLGAVRGYPITLDDHPEAPRVLAERPAALHGARTLRDRLFTLPTHSRVYPRDVRRLRDWLGAGDPATGGRGAGERACPRGRTGEEGAGGRPG